jgi:hypothetical protein
MRRVTVIALLCLIAGAASDRAMPANASSELRQWRTATGQPPSKAEFAAVVAACADRAKTSENGGQLDSCLAEFGLHRIQ